MTNFTEPTRHASGNFVVDWHDNFVHWLAWREWLHDAFGKVFFPQKLDVLFAWPPTSAEGAIGVAQALQATRDSVLKEGGNHTGTLPAVSTFIGPWQEWSADLKRAVADCEIRRREEWDNDFFEHAPRYPWHPRLGFHWAAPLERRVLLPRFSAFRDSIRRRNPAPQRVPSCVDENMTEERRAQLRALREKVIQRAQEHA